MPAPGPGFRVLQIVVLFLPLSAILLQAVVGLYSDFDTTRETNEQLVVFSLVVAMVAGGIAGVFAIAYIIAIAGINGVLVVSLVCLYVALLLIVAAGVSIRSDIRVPPSTDQQTLSDSLSNMDADGEPNDQD